jgi:hypothetical protein
MPKLPILAAAGTRRRWTMLPPAPESERLGLRPSWRRLRDTTRAPSIMATVPYSPRRESIAGPARNVRRPGEARDAHGRRRVGVDATCAPHAIERTALLMSVLFDDGRNVGAEQTIQAPELGIG